MNSESKILVAGASGLVGSAIVRKLLEKGYKNVIGTVYSKSPSEHNLPPIEYRRVDLTDHQEAAEFLKMLKPDYVFLAAAKVGGILANNIYRAEFIYKNLQIQNNVIHLSYLNSVKKLLFLGSTCIYPRYCPQPIKEEYLLTAPLEYTNESYAIAKIAGIKMCESYNLQYGTNFISVMPTNLYGYNDNFDLEKSHVLPALLRKMYIAKALEDDDWDTIRNDLNRLPIEGVTGKDSKEEILNILEKYGIEDERVEVWGTGSPKREFLWSEDMADACVFLMEEIDFQDIVKFIWPEVNSLKDMGEIEIRNTHLNIGTGEDLSIKELAYLIKEIVGFRGDVYFNFSKPDGTPRKVTDVTRLHSLGWKHRVPLEEGIRRLYSWYKGERP